MNNLKSILTWLAFLAGEALIIAGFFLWRGETPNNILTLNIIVTSIVYCVLSIDFLIPWLREKDRSHRIFGALGMRWFVSLIYAAVAIVLILTGVRVFAWTFNTLLFIHSVLLLLLIVGLIVSLYSSDRVDKVHRKEQQLREGVASIRTALSMLSEEAVSHDIPVELRDRITVMEKELRYLSPSNSPEAAELEDMLCTTISRVSALFSDYGLNSEQIHLGVSSIERLLKKRKAVFSN